MRLESTTVCTGAAPSIADVKEQIRPLSADAASIESIEYDGETPGNRTLRINFTRRKCDSTSTQGLGHGQAVRARLFAARRLGSRAR